MARILALVLTVGALSACSASAATGSSRACGPASARTLGASGAARVYAIGHTVYGCATGGSHRFTLGTSDLCIGSARVGPVAVAGRIAAYGLAVCGVDTGATTVTVRRLSDGVILARHPAAIAPGPEGFTSVAAIVVTAKGAVAWIGQGRSIVRHGVTTEVFASHGSRATRLDSGAGIATGSLRLSGNAVSWQDGSRRRSARL